MLTKTTSVAALLLAVSTGVFSGCESTPGAAALPSYVEYHDVTSAEHQAQFDTLYGEGYRIISLSVYGDPSNAQYAAVWVQRSGPAWAAQHGMTGAQFQAAFNSWAAKGFKVTQIAATGPSDNPLFAAVWEQAADGVIPITRFGLTKSPQGSASTDPTTIDYWLNYARMPQNEAGNAPVRTELIPSTLAVYGTVDDPRYAVVLEPNPARIGWNADSGLNGAYLDDAPSYQNRFNAQNSQWHRPVQVAVSYDGHYLAQFRDDSVGPWVARHDLTGAQLEQALADNELAGLMPISVQGGGPSGSITYTAIFAQTDQPQPREFTANGPVTSAAIDGVIQGFMTANGLHHASLAVMKGQALVYAKGYTYAAAGYPQAGPLTYFRTASLAKPLTSLAVQQLVQAGAFSDSDYVEDLLQWRQADGAAPADPNFSKITVQQLLQHTSGIPTGMYSESQIAQALGVQPPVSNAQMIQYMMSRTITDQAPGKGFQYANTGYWILARLVEKYQGMPFVQALTEKLGGPLGAARIRPMSSLVQDQPADEARYYDHYSQVDYPQISDSTQLVPVQYGSYIDPLYDGAASISITAVDYAKIMSSLNTPYDLGFNESSVLNVLSNSYGFDQMSQASRSAPYVGDKGGLFSGLQSEVYYAQNGLTWVAFWDRDDVYFYDQNWYPDFTELMSSISASDLGLPDLFPGFGLPAGCDILSSLTTCGIVFKPLPIAL